MDPLFYVLLSSFFTACQLIIFPYAKFPYVPYTFPLVIWS
jgi:hypothetical protein